MKTLFDIIPLVILVLGFVNLIRMSLLLIGSDIYYLRHHLSKRKKFSTPLPTFSVVIPAHNEEKTIIRAITSVLKNDYPLDKVDIVVVDDGSSDNTSKVVNDFIIENNLSNVFLLKQSNLGKSHALNNGLIFKKSDLAMCLDADSFIDKRSLIKAVNYFEDKSIVALASNVKIAPSNSLLNKIQQVEYLVCYQMKKAQSQFNIEYIIGGIGSVFRRKYIEKIGFYDTNTVTEDIDITMKILKYKNKKTRIAYASDVIAYTESVRSIGDLIKQRYRWKWGRYQTFLKNKEMFFASDNMLSRALTWVYLPYALFADLAFLLEPIIILYLLYLALSFGDFATILSAFVVLTFYMSFNIIAENTITLKKKAYYLALAPFMYLFFFILSYVEYIALIRSLINMPRLSSSLNKSSNVWQHVSRTDYI